MVANASPVGPGGRPVAGNISSAPAGQQPYPYNVLEEYEILLQRAQMTMQHQAAEIAQLRPQAEAYRYMKQLLDMTGDRIMAGYEDTMTPLPKQIEDAIQRAQEEKLQHVIKGTP